MNGMVTQDLHTYCKAFKVSLILTASISACPPSSLIPLLARLSSSTESFIPKPAAIPAAPSDPRLLSRRLVLHSKRPSP